VVNYLYAATSRDKLFIDAILARKTLVPGFYERWQTQRVIDAPRASQQHDGWVEM
jgi:hypothetical protein